MNIIDAKRTMPINIRKSPPMINPALKLIPQFVMCNVLNIKFVKYKYI